MIRRQVVVPAAPADVWEYITAPDTPDSWLGGHLEWTAEEGGPLRFEGDDGTVRRGVVETVRPPRYIRYRWWPEDDTGAPESEVAYLLEPDSDEGETRVTVSERVSERAPERHVPAPGADPDRPVASASVSVPAGAGVPVPLPAAGPAAPGPRAGSGSGHGPAPVATCSGEEGPAAVATWTAGDDRRFRAWAGAHALVVRS